MPEIFTVQWWVWLAATLVTFSAAAGVIVGLVNKALKPVKEIKAELAQTNKEIKAEIERNNAATRSTLRYSIARAHKEYMKQEYIDRFALSCIIDMYEEYKNMGGNGFISEMVEDLKRLPKSLSGGKKAFLAQRKNKEK